MDSGQLVVALPGMLDPNFDATVVFVFDTDEGAAGVILNRPTDIPLGEVVPDAESVAAAPAVVFHGGPMRVEQGIALGEKHDAIATIDLEEIDGADPGSVRVFAGYAGWDTGQLESEIDGGSWIVVPAEPGDVTTGDPSSLWRSVFARQDDPIRRYRNFPDDLRLN